MRSKFNLNNKSFNSLQRAIIYVLIGIFLLDVMGIIIKSMDNKYSVMQYAVARNFFGLFPLVIYLFFSYEVRTKNNTFNLNHKLKKLLLFQILKIKMPMPQNLRRNHLSYL